MKKFKGKVSAGSGYDFTPEEFEFEVPDNATEQDIQAAANVAAWDCCQVDYDEVIAKPKRPRKGRDSESEILDKAASRFMEQDAGSLAVKQKAILRWLQ